MAKGWGCNSYRDTHCSITTPFARLPIKLKTHFDKIKRLGAGMALPSPTSFKESKGCACLMLTCSGPLLRVTNPQKDLGMKRKGNRPRGKPVGEIQKPPRPPPNAEIFADHFKRKEMVGQKMPTNSLLSSSWVKTKCWDKTECTSVR